MTKILIDFETRSGVSLTKYGKYKYLHDKLADIVCFSYKIDNSNTFLWYPGLDLPDFALHPEGYRFYAFNCQFDRMVWHILGKKYGMKPTKLSQWTDVMAICGRFTFHQSLDQAGEDLKINTRKNKRGKALMELICEPPFEYTHQDLMEFHHYCITDTDAMYELLNALPSDKLSETEQKAWELTVKINKTGLPIDTNAVNQILNVTEAYKIEQSLLLPSLTNGKVTKGTQTKRIRNWLIESGLRVPNLQAETVINLLDRRDLTKDQRLVLQLRQELNKSSTAKYAKLKDLTFKGRIYDNERYYGSNTGRWGGMNFQLKNLPRSDVKDAQPIIDSFYDLTVIEDDPIGKAKSIVRGMICAPPGKMICAADYNAIEYIGLLWAAGDFEPLNDFAKGLDQYVQMAQFIYDNKPYNEINSDERYFGKQLILGCGYGLGAKGFLDYAEARGLSINFNQAQFGVNAYRTKYKLIVQFWYKCKKAAMLALAHPGTEFNVNRCKFRLVKDRNGMRWLRLLLPSGRALYYNKPMIREGKFGPEVSAMGINPYTKKWDRLSIIPGRFAENIVQALARDLLLNGLFNLDKAGYKILGHVHDEVLLEVPEEPNCLDDVTRLMCILPDWAPDLPLKAEGVFEKRYRKM